MKLFKIIVLSSVLSMATAQLAFANRGESGFGLSHPASKSATAKSIKMPMKGKKSAHKYEQRALKPTEKTKNSRRSKRVSFVNPRL